MEVARHQVRGSFGLARVCRDAEPPDASGHDRCLAHQLGHRIVAASNALGGKLSMNPRRPVRITAGTVDRADLSGEHRLALPTCAWQTMPRRVRAATGHLQTLSQELHPVEVPVRFDEVMLHTDSRAK